MATKKKRTTAPKKIAAKRPKKTTEKPAAEPQAPATEPAPTEHGSAIERPVLTPS